MIRRSDSVAPSPTQEAGQTGSDRKSNAESGEQRGYTAQNPTPLNAQDLQPPKGGTGVERPKPETPSK